MESRRFKEITLTTENQAEFEKGTKVFTELTFSMINKS